LRFGVITACAAMTMIASPAEARGPFPRGTLAPSLNVGGGYDGTAGRINIGGGLTYFLVNGFGVGLSLADNIVIFTKRTKDRYPGVERNLPTNTFALIPNVRYVVPTKRVSPYIGAGFGPVFYNNSLGTLGMWTAGTGVYFRLGRVLFAQVGVGLSGQVSDAKYQEITSYTTEDTVNPGSFVPFGPQCGFLSSVSNAPCSLRLSPQIGLAMGFAIPVGGGDGGGKRKKRKRRNDPETEAATPSDDSDRPPPTWGQPAEPPPGTSAGPAPSSATPGGATPAPDPMAPATDPETAPTTDDRPPPTWGQPTEPATTGPQPVAPDSAGPATPSDPTPVVPGADESGPDDSDPGLPSSSPTSEPVPGRS
jgi:opacity protein-like surface antigen